MGDPLPQEAKELRKLNRELADHEERLRLAIETGRIGLWVWNSTDTANSGDWSPRLKEIFGLPPDAEVTHELFLQCVHPEDRERVNKAVMDALAGANGGTYQEEYRTISPKDGSLHWVTARAQAFFDAEGKPYRFIGTLMEITDRKKVEEITQRMNQELERRIFERTREFEDSNKALLKEIHERIDLEAKLRQSERHLSVAQHLSMTGSFSWDAETGKIFWSDEVYRIYAIDPSVQPTMELARQRVHPEDVWIFEERAKNAPEEGKDFSFQHRLLLPDGTIKHLKVITRHLGAEMGRKGFVGALMDVTEQRKAEEALRASERLARGQVETLKEILNSISTELNPDKFLQHVLCTIAKQLGGDSASVFSRNNDNTLTFEALFEDNQLHIPKVNTTHATDDQPMWAEAMRIGTECLVTEFDRDPIWFRFVNRPVSEGVPRINDKTLPAVIELHRRLKAQGVSLSLQIPMVTSGRVSGFIGIRFAKRREFPPEEIDLSRALAHQAALAIQLMRLSRESQHAAIVGERNRMARDIHDTLAQGFTGVIAQLQAAKGATQLAEAAAHIERAQDLARSSLGEARRSVRALRPRSLHDATLCTALENMLKTVASDSGLTAKFVFEGEQRPIPPEWEEGLLRVVQESLTNAIKHAGAKTFSAKLSFEAQGILLKLVDDGRGFYPYEDHEGFGLIGMKERVEQMGGDFAIHSQPGLGTETVIALQCPAQPKSASK
jgi:PAS domain S-box-containing protein